MIASAPIVMGWVPVRKALSWMRACWERAMAGAGWPRELVVAILILVQAIHAHDTYEYIPATGGSAPSLRAFGSEYLLS